MHLEDCFMLLSLNLFYQALSSQVDCEEPMDIAFTNN